MLTLLMLALPTGFKNKLPMILKYLKYTSLAALVLAVLFVAGSLLNRNFENVKKLRESELLASKELIIKQAEKIKQQDNDLNQIKQVLEEIKQSHEKTLIIVSELKQEQKKIEIAVIKKKKSIDKALTQIDNKNIPQADKDQQKSAVLIKGLNETYCELFKDSCKEGVN